MQEDENKRHRESISIEEIQAEIQLEQLKIQENQVEFNKILALATTILAMGLLVQIIFYITSGTWKPQFTTWYAAIADIALVIFAVFLIGLIGKLLVAIFGILFSNIAK